MARELLAVAMRDRSYPLQQYSTTGTVVKVPGGEVQPTGLAGDLRPICDAIARLMRTSEPELNTVEVSLSITAGGEVAFLRSGEAAVKLTFQRVP
jgi:hypothetical protein